jgi:signal transduction histidine kinase
MSPITGLRQKAERISATDLHIRIEEGKRTDELSQLARAFNGMLDRIESAFKSQKQFVAHASHELRTPLTTIAGRLDVALMHSRSEEEYKTVMAEALDSTRQLNRLLTNLLLLSQTESELLKPLRIDDVLFSALRDIKKRYASRKIEIQIRITPDKENLLSIMGNDGLLKLAVLNVLENALKFSDAESLVTVYLEAYKKKWIILSIIDKGIGISPEDLPMIYQPFFRSNPSPEIPGNGIGLTLVKSIMDRHGGEVIIESIQGKGTTVRLSFPIQY